MSNYENMQMQATADCDVGALLFTRPQLAFNVLHNITKF